LNQYEYQAKMHEVFMTLCKRCGDRWGVHSANGCTRKDCDCKADSLNAMRSMMRDPNFKFTYVPPPKEKEIIQMKLQ
jgi:hypothetical protein